METISMISFYLSLIFGFGFGLIGFFQIGRVGAVQIFYWFSQMPPSTASNSENIRLMADRLGIPLSFNDIITDIIGLGGIKSFFSILSYFSKNLGNTISYFASIFGRIMAKTWVLIGVPAFILSIVASKNGNEYLPPWINEIGIKSQLQFCIYIVVSYIIAYFIGRIIGSPQRAFNNARISYEKVVTLKGYWFDNRQFKSHYEEYQILLKKVNATFIQIASEIMDRIDNVSCQQRMTLYYQLALLNATRGKYRDAEESIIQCRKYKTLIVGASIWDRNEERVFESQLLFLEGEIAIVLDDLGKSIMKFNNSIEIDLSLHDLEGVKKSQERLQIIERIKTSN
jgi:hypothetical protein